MGNKSPDNKNIHIDTDHLNDGENTVSLNLSTMCRKSKAILLDSLASELESLSVWQTVLRTLMLSDQDNGPYAHEVDRNRVKIQRKEISGRIGEIRKYIALIRSEPGMETPQNTDKDHPAKEIDSDSRQSFAIVQQLAASNRDRQTIDSERLRTDFNSFIETVPQATLEEKKRLGRWITAELAQYGLAVECPNNPGLPVEVKGDVGNRPGTSRFQFLPLVGGTGRKQRVFREVLPKLNFVPLSNSVDLSPSAKLEPEERQR